MKTRKYICIIFALVAFFTSCSKEKNELLDNVWIVESMKVHADSALSYPSKGRGNDIVLSFPKIGKYYLFYENISEGNTSITGDKIKLKPKMCTTIFSSAFARSCGNLLLSNANSYEISNNRLIIKGDNGEIINFIKQE